MAAQKSIEPAVTHGFDPAAATPSGPDLEQALRERAYTIWIDEGRPEGRHDAHWQQALHEHASPATDRPAY